MTAPPSPDHPDGSQAGSTLPHEGVSVFGLEHRRRTQRWRWWW